MSRIANGFATKDGRPATLGQVLDSAVKQIARASFHGTGTRLTAEQTRALEWAVIRDSTIDHAEDHWLESGAEQYLARQALQEGRVNG